MAAAPPPSRTRPASAAARLRALADHLAMPAAMTASSTKPPLRVAVSGAAGQISYSLLFNLASGYVFGPDQPLILQLLEVPVAMEALNGVVMELDDCAHPLLAEIITTSDPLVAFRDVDWALLVGAMPRREGMLRSDLLQANVGIFAAQGDALEKVAKKTVRVVVVGNPANTNALVCAHHAPSIPRENFSALTRLDENRARSQLAKRLNTSVETIRNVCIWGNHSNTQYPDSSHAYVLRGAEKTPVDSAVADDAWLKGEFIKTVSLRGAAIIKARKLSSAMSAAKAVCDHVRDWHFGTRPGEFVSMAVVSKPDNGYGIPADLCFSFPVSIKDGKWTVIPNLSISEFGREKLAATTHELEEEKREAFDFINKLEAQKAK